MGRAKVAYPAFHAWPFGLLLPILLASHFAMSQATVHDTPQANTPSEVIHVELRIGDGSRSAYHIGEIVEAKLIFTSTAQNKHWISAEHCEAEETYPVPTPP